MAASLLKNWLLCIVAIGFFNQEAVEGYIRGGGGAIFISDANLGGDWADAANSDQQFLERFGIISHQDLATVDQGRIIGHYVRNAFFHQNGAGTNINRFENRQFAVNLFRIAACATAVLEPSTAIALIGGCFLLGTIRRRQA